MNYSKTTLKLMIFFFALTTLSCGYPKPMQVKGTNEYRLHYCVNESDCFKEIKKTCPNGYEITMFRAGPERFKCK